ncbi:MAG: hypothetical protein HQM06_07380 [Magnetococcales bacterium]|nr:hypothetical protein [Magnetococcales bacterium]
MPEPLFPLFLQLTGRPCLLIGGGAVAEEKAARLLAAGARLTIVAPSLLPTLQRRAEQQELLWLAERFQAHHLNGMWFAVSTLQDASVNRYLFEEANRRHLFLNVVDLPHFCTCHWPASLERPPVTVAFSTAGTAPALAGYLRQLLEKTLPHRLGEVAEWISAWRQRVHPLLPDLEARGQFWRQLFAKGVVERFAAGEQEQAEQIIQQALQALAPPAQDEQHD